jgi:hypothetical protein
MLHLYTAVLLAVIAANAVVLLVALMGAAGSRKHDH